MAAKTISIKEFSDLQKEVKLAQKAAQEYELKLSESAKLLQLKDQQINFLGQVLIALTNIVNSPDFQSTLGSGKLWKIIANFGKVLLLVQEIIKLIKVFRDNVKFEQDVTPANPAGQEQSAQAAV